MGHAAISCYDCHVVDKNSPMASQCEGIRGTRIFISPMVSSKTCSRCHPEEVDQFLKSGHADLSRAFDTRFSARLFRAQATAKKLPFLLQAESGVFYESLYLANIILPPTIVMTALPCIFQSINGEFALLETISSLR